VLSGFRTAIDRVYGRRIERVVLYGSRARGDANPASDYDVAVFLDGLDGFGNEARTLAEIETEQILGIRLSMTGPGPSPQVFNLLTSRSPGKSP